jgi:hypothetical protein
MKKIRIKFFLLSTFILFAACEDDYFLPSPEVDLSQPVSFAAVIQPILTEDCASAGCHVGGIQVPDLSVGKAYDQLTQLGYVDTTNAENCLLYKRIIGTTKPMPPAGKLSNTKISLILAWIKQGALNN